MYLFQSTIVKGNKKNSNYNFSFDWFYMYFVNKGRKVDGDWRVLRFFIILYCNEFQGIKEMKFFRDDILKVQFFVIEKYYYIIFL